MDMKQRIKQADDQNFEVAVMKGDRPVLVDFWASWCGPCRAVGPILEELAGRYGERLDVVKINIDESPKTTTQYGVRSIPTLLFVKEGKVLETKIGLAPKEDLVALIERNL